MGNFLFSAIQGLVEHRVDFVLCGGLAQIDLLLDYPISFSDLASRAIIFAAEGVRIPVSSIPDLLKAKESLTDKRLQDLQDIAFLREKIDNG